MGRLKEFFQYHFGNPLAKELDLDSQTSLRAHRQIIEQNQLLKTYYLSVYRSFERSEETVKNLPYPSLEIGSGGGFLKEILADIITSDVVPAEGIDRVENAEHLSFPDASLKAVYANGVLHHVPDAEAALRDLERVLVPGGLLVCNEPSSTLLAHFMHRHFHNEAADKNVREWRLRPQDGAGRLTGANMALPYIIFIRDRKIFEKKFPRLRILSVVFHDFLRYTLSGGLSYKPFIPRWTYGFVNGLEGCLKPLMPVLGHAMLVTIKKI